MIILDTNNNDAQITAMLRMTDKEFKSVFDMTDAVFSYVVAMRNIKRV